MVRFSVWSLEDDGGSMKEYELDKSTGEVTWKDDQTLSKKEIELLNRLLDNYVLTSKNDGFKKCKLPYSPEFTYWYERIYLQNPSMCQLRYDDEKMWEAWKAAKEL